MPMQEYHKYFDRASFIHDVEEYMKRWKLNKTSLAALAQVDRNGLMRAMSNRTFTAKGKSYQGQLTLYYVVRLADLIDLDINKYIISARDYSESFT